ncbi:16S rRNA (guanine(966)-N(2))-methyltransferase RsmD [Ahrensia sp. R2A130]|uniref:16S rRNA (guanine(966)-N(2))-methyltransferase RsmD n=1 Tax=Ahrensia sp. R2A130 TaxID=744979 RepID=UPI0006809D5B|nr:16S rRNA (guanine(966)-N(2))-methyltransferase RsmD [Ahrensia sp. R2A130]
MRIVGGDLKGRRLATPKTDATRPTTDRNREMLFNILAHAYTEQLRGNVLDLFAGTGALGCEALSRGARSCAFVENTAAGRALLHENIEQLGLAGRAHILRRDATKLGSRDSLPTATLAFADPPYGKGLGELAAASLTAHDWLSPGGLFVLEERASSLPQSLPGFTFQQRREAGEGAFGFFLRDAA